MTAVEQNGPAPRPASPHRRYWGDRLSAEGRKVVDQLLRRYSPSYAMFADEGYTVVDDIPGGRRGVSAELTASQFRIVRQWAAQERIKKLEEEDSLLGRTRLYEVLPVSFRPRRGVKWTDIDSEEHVKAHADGVTIVGKEIHPVRSSVSDTAQAAQPVPLRRYVEQPVVAAVF